MKIAMYSPSWPPGAMPNGIVTYCGFMVDEMRKMGHQVFIVTNISNDVINDPHTIPIIPLKLNVIQKIINNLKTFLFPGFINYKQYGLALKNTLLSLHLKERLDIIEIEETFGLCGIVLKYLTIPVVVRLHGPHFLCAPVNSASTKINNVDRLRIYREGRALKNAKYITAPSKNVLENAKKYYKLSPLKDEVICNPIKKVALEKCWQISSSNANTILFVGRFDFLKGADLVIKSFTILAASNPKLKLIFIGPDNGIPDDSGNYKKFQEYTQNIMPLSIFERIEFMGFVAAEEVAKIRLRSAITIVSSRYEVFSYAVIEAMSLGCPLIATSVGGISEIVNNDMNAVVVEPNNVDSLVFGIQKLLDKPSHAEQLGKAAYETVIDKFLPNYITKQSLAFYSSAIYDYNNV